MLQHVEAIEQCQSLAGNSWEYNYNLTDGEFDSDCTSRPLTFVFRDVVGGHMIISTNWRSFFLPDFYGIHESYDTVFLGLTLYSSHKVLKRNNVLLVVKAFIFATVAAREKDYKIIDDRKLNILICTFAYSKFKNYSSENISNNKKCEKRARSRWSVPNVNSWLWSFA